PLDLVTKIDIKIENLAETLRKLNDADKFKVNDNENEAAD
ncbi:14123_t:CDS:1, partial [Racocetra fulgida]